MFLAIRVFHSQASKERRMDEAAPSQAFQTVHECVSVGVGVYVIGCVYAPHHCDNACGAQPVTRKCFARRYNSCVNRRGLEEPVAGASWGPPCGAQPARCSLAKHPQGDNCKRRELLLPRADFLRDACQFEGNPRRLGADGRGATAFARH